MGAARLWHRSKWVRTPVKLLRLFWGNFEWFCNTEHSEKYALPYVPSYGLKSHNHHHRHIVPPARISLILSLHFSLSFIASGRSSELHPVSSHSCCMYICSSWSSCFGSAVCGVHWSTSLMSLSLLPQQCPACLVRRIWIVFVMGCRWPYSWCFVGCCLQDLFIIARSILV